MQNRNMKEDLRKLANAFYGNIRISRDEFGSIGLDDKRPFGNSCVELDMFSILGIKPSCSCPHCGDVFTEDQFTYVRDLYFNKLIPYLREQWAESWVKSD